MMICDATINLNSKSIIYMPKTQNVFKFTSKNIASVWLLEEAMHYIVCGVIPVKSAFNGGVYSILQASGMWMVFDVWYQ